jgi:hypothetical protein
LRNTRLIRCSGVLFHRSSVATHRVVGQPVDVPTHEGEIFLLPPRVPHSPQRKANTVGLVIERYRRPQERDGFLWFCENCGNKLYEEYFELTDIVKQLPVVMQTLYGSQLLRTCQRCGTVMEPPVPPPAQGAWWAGAAPGGRVNPQHLKSSPDKEGFANQSGAVCSGPAHAGKPLAGRARRAQRRVLGAW